ncbi:MAG: hypothetical protein LBP22_12750 [Deltaproteobacteria bacterium]|jgi:3-dehydroquinate synthetase/shikimate kinase|nr:hypothetical protein [Deltaproteobacteria bacterium]
MTDPAAPTGGPFLPLEETIILIGFMGAGKTTVAGILAEYFKRPSVDLDEAMEQELGLTIPDIFARKGEDYFRDWEERLLARFVCGPIPRILSAGGGAVEREPNRLLLAASRTYYLKAPAEALWSRLTPQDRACRPLARDREAFFGRFAKRENLYEVSGLAVDARDAPSAVAARITEHYLKADDFSLTAEGKTTFIRTFRPACSNFGELQKLTGRRKFFFLLDRIFRSEEENLKKQLPRAIICFPDQEGEEAKNLQQAEKILTLMAEAGLDRQDYLVARGGGSLTDLGAFCAGLYKRGLNLLLWPTTLLGAVDAAVGGKTAVNLAGAKNQVGHFYLPREVWLEPEVLASLPPALIAQGLVEALKTGLLFDQTLLELIRTRLELILKGDLPIILEVARRSAKAKAAAVEKDFREEKGLRDILNLGHTYGHAVESYYAPGVSHGRAVAFGLAVAAELSRQLAGLEPELAGEVQRLAFILAGAFPPAVPPGEVQKLLRFDKKIRGGQLKFVVLKDIGQPEVLSGIEPASVIKAAGAVSARFQK